MRMLRRKASQRGQAAIEYAIIYTAILLPVTMMIVFTAELIWVWHSAVEMTREGARYAVTHCYQAGGDNVITYMRENLPLMINGDDFRDGLAEIEVLYYGRDPDSGELVEFSCEGSDCSRECVPEAVTVRINNYEFQGFFTYLGLPPITMPSFQTSMPMESAGCSADSEECVP